MSANKIKKERPWNMGKEKEDESRKETIGKLDELKRELEEAAERAEKAEKMIADMEKANLIRDIRSKISKETISYAFSFSNKLSGSAQSLPGEVLRYSSDSDLLMISFFSSKVPATFLRTKNL